MQTTSPAEGEAALAAIRQAQAPLGRLAEIGGHAEGSFQRTLDLFHVKDIFLEITRLFEPFFVYEDEE